MESDNKCSKIVQVWYVRHNSLLSTVIEFSK